jgi:hypothetical protein
VAFVLKDTSPSIHPSVQPLQVAICIEFARTNDDCTIATMSPKIHNDTYRSELIALLKKYDEEELSKYVKFL